MPASAIDPWYVDANGEPDPFLRVDFEPHKEDDEINLPERDPAISLEQHPNLNPDVVVVQGEEHVLGPLTHPVPVEPEGPEVVDLPDGGTLTFQKTSKGWEAILDNGTSAKPEVFKGKNKNELMIAMASGKLNATKKIRDLNRELKLGSGGQAPQQASQALPQARSLTADEIFEIKTQLDSNPDLALSTWFQKQTGMSVSDLAHLARKGANADTQVSMDSVNRTFLNENPDYYPDQEFKNFNAIVRYISKHKTGKNIKDADAAQTATNLYESGFWTVENLEEAFQELSDDGLLVLAPRSSKQAPPEPVAPVVQETRPPGERIVSQVTRPRAALGIRTSDITPVAPPAPPTAPSAEDFESMTDEQIRALMAASLQHRRQSRR
jgi:hypothetical protein